MKGSSGNFRIEGLRETQRAMRDLGKSVSKAAAGRALMRGGEIVARAMRGHAPHLTDALFESIDVGARAAPHQRKRFDVERYVGPGRDAGAQAGQQEFGNENHGPQPYARPGFDESARPALEEIGHSVMYEFEASARRIAARAKRGTASKRR